jgi:hypothetical protein
MAHRIYLKPRECAILLGVTAEYIVGEIKDGRLTAMVHETKEGRVRYRVDVEDWRLYVVTHWPRKMAS